MKEIDITKGKTAQRNKGNLHPLNLIRLRRKGDTDLKG